MKKAILAVSFGTSCTEAEQTCILPIEESLHNAYPEYEVFRAFTSRIIIRKLCGQGIAIENEQEALERLTSEGYGEIAVVPTHIIPGREYEKVRGAAAGRRISAPLLNNESDLIWMAGLLGEIAAEEERPLILMGHGTEHSADETYLHLREKLPSNVFLACIDGNYTLETLLPVLESLPEKRVTLMPLMLVAGDHARNDLASDKDESWKSILKSLGFDVRVRLQGLGALTAVQQRFIEKARAIL